MIPVLNDWASAWGPWFLATVVQNTVFLGLVFLVLFLLRSTSARVKAAVATLGVLKLVIPPVVPAHWLGPQKVEQVAQGVGPLLFPFAETPPAAVAGNGGLTGLLAGMHPLTLVMLVWALVALVRLGWTLVQTLDLALAVRDSHPLARTDLPEQPDLPDHTIMLSRRISVPLTLGIFARRIYVPAAWQDWSAAERRAVLRHELAHLKRNDGLVQLAEAVAHAVFFFHPLVTLLIRRLRVWREMACDDQCVADDALARLAYSQFLIRMAETALGPRPATESASTLARRKCELFKRVTYQVREGAMMNVSRTKLSLILVLLLLAAVPLSLAFGKAAPPPPPPPPAAPPVEAEADRPAPPDNDDLKRKKAQLEKEKLVKKGKGGENVPPPPPNDALHFTLTEAGTLLHGKPLPPAKVAKILDKAAQLGEKAPVIIIDNDGGVPMGSIHAFQKELRDRGLQKIKYTGTLGKSVAMILPPAEVQEKLASLPPGQVLDIRIDREGVVTLNKKKVQGARIAGLVSSSLEHSPDLVVALHTGQDTRYGAFVQVLEALKEAGASRIAILDPGS